LEIKTMSIQSSLNNQAFTQLPLTYAAIRRPGSAQTRGNIEAIALRHIERCSPALDDMSAEQKFELDQAIVDELLYKEHVELFYTADAEGGQIFYSATISAVERLSDLTAQLNQAAAELEVVDWVKEQFGDCWVKLSKKPETDADGYAVIDGIECHVREPGTHPGGDCYCLTPVVDVLVPTWKAIDNI
jgi:hypothetical protein